MDPIEQAVFTSAQTSRAAGYQVVGASPGVCEADLRELATWCPSHDALVDSSPSGVSVNFHPLPSGAYCVSRTTPAGWEYSARGGVRVYTQCLIVSPETLLRFANNPFALLRAMLARGALRVHDEVPERLAPVWLAGRAAPVDAALLERLAADPGVEWMAALVQAALSSSTLALVYGPPAEHLAAGLLNCLPPECRTEVSFSTGLKFSSRRPFRLVALGGDREEQRRVRRVYNLHVLDLSARPPEELRPIDSWPRLVERVLRAHRLSFLAARFAERHPDFSPGDLPALGLQLLEELDAAPEDETPCSDGAAEAFQGDDLPSAPTPERADLSDSDGPPRNTFTRPQAAHRRFQKTLAAAVAPPPPSALAPSRDLDPSSPEVLEKLELLDDLVFAAVTGSAQALDQLRALWPRLRAELGGPLLAESREQYVRYAISLWGDTANISGMRDSGRAVQALEVLCVLFDEV